MGEKMNPAKPNVPHRENPFIPGVRDVEPQDAWALAQAGEVVLIDVRQPTEYTGELGHSPNSKLIVLDDLANRWAEIPRDKPVVFVCRSGGRSAHASAAASQAGIRNTFNMRGGMILWNQLSLPTENSPAENS
jgi:hydroxyacylglutathione hydrolase